jgi:hypothetical protein
MTEGEFELWLSREQWMLRKEAARIFAATVAHAVAQERSWTVRLLRGLHDDGATVSLATLAEVIESRPAAMNIAIEGSH